VLRPHQREKLARGANDKEHAMPSKLNIAIASVIGIDIGKNSFHVVAKISAVPSCCGKSKRHSTRSQ